MPLSAYRDQPAWVLLGDPGAGKTTAFEQESKAVDGEYITARDFCAMGPMDASKTLFIDGLDEMRANEGGQGPLQQMRLKLMQCRPERFRISCREADWLGASDLNDLKRLSADQQILALRLNPLTLDDVLQILAHKKSKEDAIDFVQQAQNFGVEELLCNPQTLQLLMQVVAPGQPWPQTRHQLYELACRKMVLESNRRHRDAMRETAPPDDQLLDAAGLLCAIQLLSGLAGFALDDVAADEQHATLRELVNPRNLPLLAALKTRLFVATGEQERMVPVHRTVAEYLAAQYVAQAVSLRGLPLGRVLALLTGNDGGMMPDLRGLAAWMAVHCLTARKRLIEVDAFGVVLYGDVHLFSMDDKKQILHGLRMEAQRYPAFRAIERASFPFGALATIDMEQEFLRLLVSSERTAADQSLLLCVLNAIEHGIIMADLSEPLDLIIRDGSYDVEIRSAAAAALLHIKPDDFSYWQRLLQEIQRGDVEDRDDDLAGDLLRLLYPSVISPTQVFDYLSSPKYPFRHSEFYQFWVRDLVQISDQDHLPELLAQIKRRKAKLEKLSDYLNLKQMIGTILLQCLTVHGDNSSDAQLYAWLGVGLHSNYGCSQLDAEYAQAIASWLVHRPGRCKAIILYGEEQCRQSSDMWLCLVTCFNHLYGAKLGDEFIDFFLNKAMEYEGDVARLYLQRAIDLLWSNERSGLITTYLEPWIKQRPEFQQWLAEYIGQERERTNVSAENRAIGAQQEDDNRKRIVAALLPYQSAIHDGSAPPGVFHQLVLIYKGQLQGVTGGTPDERLGRFFDNDQAMISAIHHGLREIILRDDMPSAAEIISLAAQGQMLTIQSACLIGMSELFDDDPGAAMQLDNRFLERLLAFQLIQNISDEPAWYGALLQQRPELLESVIVPWVSIMLRSGRDRFSVLNLIAYKDAYRELRTSILPQLLADFPILARKEQVSLALDPLLKSALHHLPPDILEPLIARKLALKSIVGPQRIYWLLAGTMVFPDVYADALRQYAGESESRLVILVDFFRSNADRYLPDPTRLPAKVIVQLIELIAPDASPERPDGVYFINRSIDAGNMVRALIHTLGAATSEGATLALERLLASDNMARWHVLLRSTLYAQRIASRKALYRPVGWIDVSRMLANLQPANAADLAALVFAHLCDIGKQIRDGNADEYQQFWDKTWEKNEGNVEPARVLKSITPKWENDCRQVLLPKLQAKLAPLLIDAQPEAEYADQTRADIRVSFAGGQRVWNVPVEIKKDTHKELWTAIPNQLIPRYVRDPGTDGYGIYLVFWFGGGKGMPLSPQGRRPNSAQELEQWLLARLTPHERAHIFVCVIDCAWPHKTNLIPAPEPEPGSEPEPEPASPLH